MNKYDRMLLELVYRGLLRQPFDPDAFLLYGEDYEQYLFERSYFAL